jgi:hypothetical protein
MKKRQKEKPVPPYKAEGLSDDPGYMVTGTAPFFNFFFLQLIHIFRKVEDRYPCKSFPSGRYRKI